MNEQKPNDILWCCHVRGPDDVHAAPDYETALKWADIVNEIDYRFLREGTFGTSALVPMMCAVPAPWPWSAEAHAEGLPKSIDAFSKATGQTV